MKRQFVGLLAFLFAASIGSMGLSQSVLVVSNGDGSAMVEFSMDDLKALPQTEIVTSNDFVDGIKHFHGPLARDVLKKAGAVNASVVTMTAANDYQVEIPVHEFFDYNAILALDMDGHLFSKRDKGPIWVIYPMSDFEELRDPVFNSRLIWQLVRLEYR